MSDKQTIAEKYMSARTTSSLKLKAETTSSPADILTAAGMVGGRQGLAMQLWSVTHSPSKAHLMSLSQTLAHRLDGYMLSKKIKAREHAASIAQTVLLWHLYGTCKYCNGTKRERIQGTPHLSDVECPRCNGTGRIPLVTAHDDSAKWLHSEIEQLTVIAEMAMGQKLHR